MMKKSWLLNFLLVMTLLIVTACGAGGNSGNQNNDNGGGENTSSSSERVMLTVSTGSNTAVVYAYASTWARIISEQYPEIMLNVQTSGGGKENMSRLVEGRADIGVGYGPEVEAAVRGLNEYEGQAEKYAQLRGILTWPYAAVQLVVREDSGINSIEDLKGKRIAVGAPGSTGSTFVWPYVLPEFGITEENSNWQYLSQTAAAEALGDGAVDAITALSKAKVGAIESLSLSHKIKLLPIPDPQRQNIIQNSYGLIAADQDPDLYGLNQVNDKDKPIPTIGMTGTFLVHESVPEEVVYKITKALFDNIDAFYMSHSAAKDITLEGAIQDMPVPLHPGAEKYYKEVGLIQ